MLDSSGTKYLVVESASTLWTGLTRLENAITRDQYGVSVPSNSRAWSGSTGDGTLAVGETCADWTIGDGTSSAAIGDYDSTSGLWIFTGFTGDCMSNNTRRIYCISD